MVKYKDIGIIFLLVVYSVLVIVWCKDISEYVLTSIKLCINVIVPSLYIFMIISDFFITSNVYVLFGRPFSLFSRYVFRIPEQYFSIFLISSIGGYPVGAKLLSDLSRSNIIDIQSYKDMLPYCYLSGPAFICSIVGVNIFSDIKIGVLIFISIFISNLIIAAVIGRKRKIPNKNVYKLNLNLSIDGFIKSISNGGKSILNICVIIIFFSSIICIIDKLGIVSVVAHFIDKLSCLSYSNSMAVIKSSIEISNISLFDGDKSLIPLISALLSFGGLCVIIQIKVFTNRFSIKNFVFFRIISMLLSYFICKIICVVIYNDYLMSNSPAYLAHGQNSPIQTAFLLIMTILFLLKFSIEKSRKI